MTENNLTWVLVADASTARLFAMHKAKIFNENVHTNDFKLLQEFFHHESRMKDTELATDKMGGFGAGTFVENTTPKVYEAQLFAHHLIEHLEAGRKSNSFKDFILIAPPAFMGFMHKPMSHELKKYLDKTIEKDYTKLTGRKLLEAVINHL